MTDRYGKAFAPPALLAAAPALLAILLLTASSAAAQTRVGFDPSGVWTAMYHEDELERTDPGPPVGDYLGLPINDAARLHGDSWEGDLVSVPEHQCIPHSSIYSMRGPSGLKISTINETESGEVIAFIIDGTYTGPRTIWMDGRVHPGPFAAHTWAGFSTGTWEGDTLRVETTHIKSGYLRRNGINFSDLAVLTEFFDMQDKYLTVTTVAEDPVYLTEPLVRSESWVWNPYQRFAPIANWGSCLPHPELAMPPGWVPHHLPGENTLLPEFPEQYGVPLEAARGGAETMYPEYQKKLRTMEIPRAKAFERKFEREHPGQQAGPSPAGSRP
jgi:hypothetical protein